ncbi:hypothetical protein AMAG_13576 [Allomyces macrogynus ATCC 38327]|uniref:Cyclic nucleotide-binding domain-containing protein n=1 Tax=Allomyces macrogynus (strain ATCC 38327) TaxID=578462 RepID=A0A0L0T381_ALLM3|nr:hypothetical protein AMAG_13576 [Allomyces macrogynus ATCC 38327]|eukprot:KNE69181.1 hypothetical protein AMAG_13576 [Allomyces macrogynus ATCC 38327]
MATAKWGGGSGGGIACAPSRPTRATKRGDYLISIPTLLAFLCDYSLSYTFQFIALDCLFLVALALQLLRPRFDRYGQLVTDRKEKIRVFLQRPTAWLEIAGAIPVDWVIIFWVLATDSDMSCLKPTYVYSSRFFDQPQPGLTLTGVRYDYQRSNIPLELLWYGILRSIKMMRTAPTFLWAMNAKIPRIPDTISRLLKTLVFSIFLSHVDSCCFWVMETTITSEQRWITAARVIVDADGNLTSFTERYLRNFYGSQRALYFIPRDVSQLQEIVFQAIEMLIAAVLYGSIFGNLASIVRALDSRAALDKAAKQRNFKKEFLAHYMIEHGFPPALQRKILDHEEFDWQHKKGLDLESLFGDLPPAYRQEVAAHLYYDLVCSVPIFKNTSRAFRLALCERITSIRLPRGFLVCKAGDQANEAFIISAGAVDVLTPDESQVVVELKTGAFFGEIGLFEKTTRNATIKTTVETTLCVLRKDYFHAVLDNYPDIKDRLGKEITKRKQQQTQVIAQRKREQQAEQEERERVRQQDHLQLNDLREVKASSATSLGSSFLSHLRVKRPSLRNGSGSVSAGALPGIAAAGARSKSTTLIP